MNVITGLAVAIRCPVSRHSLRTLRANVETVVLSQSLRASKCCSVTMTQISGTLAPFCPIRGTLNPDKHPDKLCRGFSSKGKILPSIDGSVGIRVCSRGLSTRPCPHAYPHVHASAFQRAQDAISCAHPATCVRMRGRVPARVPACPCGRLRVWARGHRRGIETVRGARGDRRGRRV